MKATQLLMDEHKHILLALYILEQMAVLTERGESVRGPDVDAILRFLKVFADQHHQGKEEAVLFPALLKAAHPVHKDVLAQMIFEHGQERSMLEGLEEALRTEKAPEFVGFAERLVEILRTHIFKEDHVLFEMADDVLSVEQDIEAENGLKDYDRAWQENACAGLLATLHRLELEYLSRTTRPEPDSNG